MNASEQNVNVMRKYLLDNAPRGIARRAVAWIGTIEVGIEQTVRAHRHRARGNHAGDDQCELPELRQAIRGEKRAQQRERERED
jgi:hypothetical protein